MIFRFIADIYGNMISADPINDQEKRTGIFIHEGGIPEIFSGIGPQRLAASHRAWSADVSAFGPWDNVSAAGFESIGRIRRARGYEGPASIHITGPCISTMDAAGEFIRRGVMKPWSSVIALRQTAGRGRRKRRWDSPPGNLYGTWYWPVSGQKDDPASGYRNLASLLAGDILAAVLREQGIEVRIKWPNDIILGERKLCGILVEGRGAAVLVGIGINLVSAPEDGLTDDDFALPAVCLDPEGRTFRPLSFWARLMETGRAHFENTVHSIKPPDFVRRLEDNLAWRGRRVMVRKEKEPAFDAILSGLAPDGALIIRRNGETQILYSATIRPA